MLTKLPVNNLFVKSLIFFACAPHTSDKMGNIVLGGDEIDGGLEERGIMEGRGHRSV